MNGFLLTSKPFVQIFFHNPEVLLFGCLLMLMSATVVLVFLIKSVPQMVSVLLSGLVLVQLLLDGILIFDLAGTVSPVYTETTSSVLSEVFSTHRWLLMPVPVLFILLAMIILSVCRNALKEKHAREYVLAAQFCVVVSFLTILLIGVESLI